MCSIIFSIGYSLSYATAITLMTFLINKCYFKTRISALRYMLCFFIVATGFSFSSLCAFDEVDDAFIGEMTVYSNPSEIITYIESTDTYGYTIMNPGQRQKDFIEFIDGLDKLFYDDYSHSAQKAISKLHRAMSDEFNMASYHIHKGYDLTQLIPDVKIKETSIEAFAIALASLIGTPNVRAAAVVSLSAMLVKIGAHVFSVWWDMNSHLCEATSCYHRAQRCVNKIEQITAQEEERIWRERKKHLIGSG